MKIKVFTVGGTIDKIYFDKKNEYEIGEPMTGDILQEAQVNFTYHVESIMKKDSLDMTDKDRKTIFSKIKKETARRIIVTHGTDTMIATAKALSTIAEKVIVLTGAMSPARFRTSDAAFNLGCAIAAVQILPAGTYIAMNGRIFHPDNVRKNLKRNRFEEIE